MTKKPTTSTIDDNAAPVLLSGDNPKIAKGYGDEPVQAYIAALPGWKQDACCTLDKLIAQTIPGVSKAVKWNSSFYGVTQGEWFLSFHAMTKYIKIAFFTGADLSPPPPETSTQANIRYWHIREGDTIDESQFIDWLQQASQRPGVRM